MAVVIEIDDNRDGYKTVVDAVLSEGTKVPSRNGMTVEVRDMVIVLKNPAEALPVGVGRGVKQAIGAVEAAQLVGGVSDPKLTCAIAPNFKNFLDEGHFWGAYGPRTARQFYRVEDKLRKDQDTRQAIITIWDPHKDNIPGKRDYPCTIMHDFIVRDGKLHMTTVMRSNDVWWGWAYDAFQFTAVQLTMANVLGLEIGEYVHHAVSMHLYEPHWELATQLHEYDGAARPPAHGFTGGTWGEAADSADNVLKRSRDISLQFDWDDLTVGERWYIQTMRKALLT